MRAIGATLSFLTLLVAPLYAAPNRISSTLPSAMPRELQRAFHVQGLIGERRLQSDLNGATQGEILASVQIETKENFHIYKDRVDFWTENDSETGQPWQVDVLRSPASKSFYDPVSQGIKEGYAGQSLFELRLRLPQRTARAFPPGHRIPLVVYLQSCNDKVCLLPIALKIELALNAASTAAPTENNFSFADLATHLTEFLNTSLSQSHGIGIFTLLILFGAGILTAFTPCVYPLYPITLGIFSRWTTTTTAGKVLSPFFLSLAYCCGLTLSYASLGLLSAASGAIFGSLTQTPFFLIGVGLLMLLSALFFSGLWNFTFPPRLQKFFEHNHGHNYFSAAIMGAGLGVVGSPCVGPVLVVLLAWLSSTLGHGSSAYLQGFILLSAFGFGMSLPFMGMAHFIFRLKRTPHLGRYTPHVKHFGTGLMVLASFLFLIPGYQQWRGQNVAASTPLPYTPLALEQWSQKEPKNWTVIDFRADWCPACLELEHHTFAHPSVADYFKQKGWDFVKIDMTQINEASQRIAQRFGVVSLPSVLIFAPGGKACRALTLHNFETAAAFIARLTRAQARCR